ncbi:MAG: hypothetical protein BWK78_08505 [Thiotrichaceae bacterium IS1]|nr:MAG: hypothetical protein BWK78_08505 [Thiotrichaceae bacterium IS1]
MRVIRSTEAGIFSHYHAGALRKRDAGAWERKNDLANRGPGENPNNILEFVCLGEKFGMGMKRGPTSDESGPQKKST